MADLNIEQIVAQVLAEMQGKDAPAPKAAAAPAKAAGGAIPATSRVAMLTALDIQSRPSVMMISL